MRTGHHPSRQARALSILATLAILLTLTVGVVPGTAYAAQTITIAPTQPVYLVNNGDTAYVGYRMTYAGTPTTGLEQDITLTIATGGLLQVGAAPGGLTGVNTTLAGGSSTIAGGNTTLAQGSGTLSAASAIGAPNVSVSSVTILFVGQAIKIYPLGNPAGRKADGQ